MNWWSLLFSSQYLESLSDSPPPSESVHVGIEPGFLAPLLSGTGYVGNVELNHSLRNALPILRMAINDVKGGKVLDTKPFLNENWLRGLEPHRAVRWKQDAQVAAAFLERYAVLAGDLPSFKDRPQSRQPGAKWSAMVHYIAQNETASIPILGAGWRLYLPSTDLLTALGRNLDARGKDLSQGEFLGVRGLSGVVPITKVERDGMCSPSRAGVVIDPAIAAVFPQKLGHIMVYPTAPPEDIAIGLFQQKIQWITKMEKELHYLRPPEADPSYAAAGVVEGYIGNLFDHSRSSTGRGIPYADLATLMRTPLFSLLVCFDHLAWIEKSLRTKRRLPTSLLSQSKGRLEILKCYRWGYPAGLSRTVAYKKGGNP